MKAFKITYGCIGLLIISLCLYFGSRGLPEKNRELYNRAYSISNAVESRIWSGFHFNQYPVAVRKRSTEYVLQGRKETKREAVLPVTAATAYKMKDGMNILIPCKEDMDSLGQMAEGLSGSGDELFTAQFALDKEAMPDNRYIAILYHEGLHALQLDNYFERMTNILPKHKDDIDFNGMLGEIDGQTGIMDLYKKETKTLYGIIKSKDKAEFKTGIKEYLAIRSEREKAVKSRLGAKKAEDFIRYENFYELMEGTARYMEIRIAEILKDEKLYDEYLDSLQESGTGREKYYRSGMGICLVLDKLSSEWKDDIFSRAVPLSEVLNKLAEV
ncbi:MAG: hypothetical protein N3B21_11330 [Clostridia bacterium]|nr:hypothetical protein [Clostridia bacterium]